MLLSVGTWAQQVRMVSSALTAPDAVALGLEAASREDAPLPRVPIMPLVPVLPRMSAELALDTYERRASNQPSTLAAYSDTTIIHADLPDSRQRGEYELKRSYSAPNVLRFTPVRFLGDGFVKTNVIVRVLQSEVTHVSKQRGAETALNDQNYKISYKGMEQIDGRPLYAFNVKPRKKRPGLFKGRIFIDPFTGSLRRAEGTMVKSPSWFVKKVEFVQDYEDVGGFILPVRMHSVAKARIIGRTIVDVEHRDYQAQAGHVQLPSAEDASEENTLSASSN